MRKKMKKRTKVIIAGSVILLLAIGGRKDESNISNIDMKLEESTELVAIESESESERESEEKESDSHPYDWSHEDYERFYVALKMIADKYLTGHKVPFYDKWTFAMFDDYRIFAMTEELTFKGDHNKHTAMCVFYVTPDGKSVYWSYFATDEKIYYNDGSCDEVFDKIKSLYYR